MTYLLRNGFFLRNSKTKAVTKMLPSRRAVADIKTISANKPPTPAELPVSSSDKPVTVQIKTFF